MKASLVLGIIWIVALGALLSFSTPAFADQSRDMVSQALDLTQLALNQDGGDSSSNEQRRDLLTHAMSLLGNETDHFNGHVGKAMNAIRAALAKIKKGDPYHTATGDIRKASSQLHTAMSMAT
jgi:hypothetical protein